MSSVDPVVHLLADLDHPARPTVEFQDALLARLFTELGCPAAEPRPREGRPTRVLFLRGVSWRYRGRRRLIALAAAALVVIVGTASAFGTVRDLIFGSGGSAYASPTWSPDGRRIAFLHYSWDGSVGGTTEVYVMNADGSGQRNLTREWGREVSPIWSPDWRKIAFVRDPCPEASACARTAYIYVMNPDGSRLQRVARGGKVRRHNVQWFCPCAPDPAWSPDGRKIAFGSERDGNVELYVMNLDGSNQRRLTRSPETEESLTWSPDGRKIAFVRSIRGRGVRIAGVPHPGRPLRQEIYVMNADGSGQRMLGRGHAPAWSRDGRTIAFRSDRDGNGEVYVVNADGTGLRRLTHNPASDGRPLWSPEGQKIFFVRFQHGNIDIYVVNADGSGERNLTPDARTARRAYDGSPVLSPDGRRIAFVSGRDGNQQIYVMNADGSRQRRLTPPKPTADLTVEPSRKLTRTVDGMRFTLYVPKTGWETGPVEKIGNRFRTRGLLISKSTRGGQAAEEVIYWIGIHGNGDVTPCSKVLPSAADLSTDDLAAAIARAPGTKLGGGPRSDSTVGVLPATSVVVRVKETLGCQPGYFFTWPHSGCFGACWRRTDVGDSIGVKIVEVSGKRLLFVVITKPKAGEHQEIGDIVRSVRFG